MTINPTSTSSIDLWSIAQSTSTSSAAGATAASTAVTGSSDSLTLSGPAQLFKELDALSSSNPAEFTKMTAQIADQLKTAAQNTTDPEQADALNQMAANFRQASTSGKFSDLLPGQQGTGSTADTTGSKHVHRGGHHAHRASTQASSDGLSDSSDPLSSIVQQALSQIQTDLPTASLSTDQKS